jgi:GAF domain-containing protein/FixJ family two-component response regulator/two-component sensor histidine kinase
MTEPESGARTPTILVVEDDRTLAAALERHLARDGHRIVTAHTGAAGLAVLREAPCALLIVDARLPDLDGVAVMNEARRLPDPPEVVLMTGHPGLESAIAAVEAGAAGYLVKPFAFGRLGALVGRALERRGLARENARLHGELAERLGEAESMLAIASAIGTTLDLREALRRVCRALVRLTDADTAAAYLHDPGRDLLVPTAAYHVPKDALPTLTTATIPLREQGFHLPLWQSRRPVVSDDVGRDPRFTHELFRAIPHRSGLLLPLILDEDVAGAFYLVWWQRRRAFTDRELAVLEQISGEVALLLRNARLFARADEDRRRLDALYAVSRRLAAVHDRDQLLSMILDESTRLLGADGAAIRLVEGDDLVLVAHTESVTGVTVRPRVRVGESLIGRVAATGEPVALEDLRDDAVSDPKHRRGALDRGFRGFLAVPLRAHGQTIGTLSLFARQTRRFAPEEVSLLSSLADHASLAIERARLLRETDEGRETLARLYRVAVAMQDSLDRRDRVEAFVRGAREVLGFDRVNVLLADAADANLELFAALEDGDVEPPARIPLSPAAGPYHRAFQTRRPVIVLTDADLAAAPAMDPALLDHAFFRTRRFVVVPLVVGDRAIGAVSADNKTTRRAIGPRTIEPFTLLCRQLAMALEESRLYAEARRREDEVTRLYQVTGRLAASLELDHVADVVTDEAVELLGADASIIFRLDEGRGELTPWRARNYDPALLRDVVLKPGEGLAGRAVVERRVVASRDLHEDASLEYGDALRRRVRALPARAGLAAPLVSRGRVYGVVAVNRFDPYDFGPDEVRLLSALADQAAIAVENARLYAETRARERETARLYEITGQLAGSLDFDRVVDLVVENARDLLGCDASGIYTHDETRGGLTFLRGLHLDPELTRALVLKPGEGVAGRAFEDRRPVWTRDRLADPALAYGPAADRLIRARAPRAYLAVPIVSRGQVHGVLVGYFVAPHDFTPEEVQLLSTLGDHAAIALENARLYAETRAREQEATRLYSGLALLTQASRALYRTLDVDAMLNGALAELARAFGAGSVLVNVMAEDGRVVRRIGHWLSEAHGRDVLVQRAGVGALARGTREPVVLHDIAEHRDLVNPAHFRHGVRSLAAFPIIGQAGPVLGVLLLYYTTPQEFPEGELRLLTAYAGQLATALENAQLYQESQTQRTRLQLIFDSTSDGIVLLGRDGRVEAANRRAGELLGFDPGVVGGAGVSELLGDQVGAPGELERAVASLRLPVQDPDRGGAGDLEIARPLRRVLHWVGQPTKDALGATVGLTLTFQDVTEEREVSRMKSDFVSFVTHQLRTPLAGIKWLLELTAQEERLPEPARSYVDDARQSNERLIQLVNDLLNVSRLESGKLTVVPRPVDLAAVTRSVVDELAALLRDKGHALTVHVPREASGVMADPQLCRQIVLNLLGNAIKYTPAGGRVDIRAKRAGTTVRWEIQDTGIGIPADGQRRLFEKFYRADNVRTIETEGTGLGLYLVRLLVEQQNGRIACESEEGKGSTFVVTLPAAG